MANRLDGAISPYLRSHADNPVDWWPWGADAFAEAARRDVPVLVSIGYSSCHWCHVMARESFSDPATAAQLNGHFVAIKVDREEHPDVDASYMAAAGAFTRNLGWPLTVFATPGGHPFFAGSYFPPAAANGLPGFREVLSAVQDAWASRRGAVDATATTVAEALAASGAGQRAAQQASRLPDDAELARAVALLAALEDPVSGGLGTPPDFADPKFPVAPVLGFLLSRADGAALGARTLKLMGASPLRDPVEGGFFRYSTRRDWGDPHYERMLYDNALLLDAAVRAGALDPGAVWARTLSEALAGFLLAVLRLPGGAFASAQDSESMLDGRRSEGGYYALEEDARSEVTPPALDEKVLAGWNGLAIGALARAGAALQRPEWVDAARDAAEAVTRLHLRRPGEGGRQPGGGSRLLARASLGGRVSAAPATLEDYGMLAGGLLALAVAGGDARPGVIARELVDACLAAAEGSALPFAVPGGAEDVLAAQGMALELDTAEGAYPSGLSAVAAAAYELSLLSGDRRYRAAAEAAVGLVGPRAAEHPLGYGALLALAERLRRPVVQLVSVVTGDPLDAGGDELLAKARRSAASVSVNVTLTEAQAEAFADAGFELFVGRRARGGQATSYLCEQSVCRLPVTDAAALAALLGATPTGAAPRGS